MLYVYIYFFSGERPKWYLFVIKWIVSCRVTRKWLKVTKPHQTINVITSYKTSNGSILFWFVCFFFLAGVCEGDVAGISSEDDGEKIMSLFVCLCILTCTEFVLTELKLIQCSTVSYGKWSTPYVNGCVCVFTQFIDCYGTLSSFGWIFEAIFMAHSVSKKHFQANTHTYT